MNYKTTGEQLEMNEQIADKPTKTKNFMTAGYSITKNISTRRIQMDWEKMIEFFSDVLTNEIVYLVTGIKNYAS